MKKYFVHNGEKQKGPFTFEELKEIGIVYETKIWHEGLSEWTNAGNISELKEIITQSPPPIAKDLPFSGAYDKAKKLVETDYVNEIENKIPNKTGKRIFKGILIILSILGIIFLFKYLRPTEESKEKNNVAEYLKIETAELKNIRNYSFYSQKEDSYWKIEGKIINNAVNTTYKDVNIEVEFFTFTKTSLGKQKIILYQLFRPSKEKESYDKYSYFDVKLDQEPPKSTYISNTQFKITDAEIFRQEKASQ